LLREGGGKNIKKTMEAEAEQMKRKVLENQHLYGETFLSRYAVSEDVEDRWRSRHDAHHIEAFGKAEETRRGFAATRGDLYREHPHHHAYFGHTQSLQTVVTPGGAATGSARGSRKNRKAKVEISSREEKAATKIDAAARGFLARRSVVTMRVHLEQKQGELAAATKIEACFRGHKARMDMKQPCEVSLHETQRQMMRDTASNVSGSRYKAPPKQSEALIDDEKRARAATKIAANFRRHQSMLSVDILRKQLVAEATVLEHRFGGKPPHDLPPYYDVKAVVGTASAVLELFGKDKMGDCLVLRKIEHTLKDSMFEEFGMWMRRNVGKVHDGADSNGYLELPGLAVAFDDFFRDCEGGLRTFVADDSVSSLGLLLHGAPPGVVLISGVEDSGWGHECGIKEGDRIMCVNCVSLAVMDPTLYQEALLARPVRISLLCSAVRASKKEQKAPKNKILLERNQKKSESSKIQRDQEPPDRSSRSTSQSASKLPASRTSSLPRGQKPGPARSTEDVEQDEDEEAQEDMEEDMCAHSPREPPLADMAEEELPSLLPHPSPADRLEDEGAENEDNEEAEQAEMAAIKIQACQRGRSVRKKVKSMKQKAEAEHEHADSSDDEEDNKQKKQRKEKKVKKEDKKNKQDKKLAKDDEDEDGEAAKDVEHKTSFARAISTSPERKDKKHKKEKHEKEKEVEAVGKTDKEEKKDNVEKKDQDDKKDKKDKKEKKVRSSPTD